MVLQRRNVIEIGHALAVSGLHSGFNSLLMRLSLVPSRRVKFGAVDIFF